MNPYTFNNICVITVCRFRPPGPGPKNLRISQTVQRPDGQKIPGNRPEISGRRAGPHWPNAHMPMKFDGSSLGLGHDRARQLLSPACRGRATEVDLTRKNDILQATGANMLR